MVNRKDKYIRSIHVTDIDENIDKDISIIFDWISKSIDVNTDNIEPFYNPISLYSEDIIYQREDSSEDCFPREDLQRYTSCKDNNFFTVPKVINR